MIPLHYAGQHCERFYFLFIAGREEWVCAGGSGGMGGGCKLKRKVTSRELEPGFVSSEVNLHCVLLKGRSEVFYVEQGQRK